MRPTDAAFVEVANPTSPLPNQSTRPPRHMERADNRVPHANVSGSTSVLCTLSLLVRLSPLILANPDCAPACKVKASEIAARLLEMKAIYFHRN